MRLLPKGVAYTFNFKMVLATDGHSVATGKTVAITISKNGAAFANPAAGATNATELANGIYTVALGAGDTDTEGDLIVRGTATACDDLLEICQVAAGAKLLDGVAHGGDPGTSTATIAAAHMRIDNPAGFGIHFEGSDGNFIFGNAGAGLDIEGEGDNPGIYVAGGSSGISITGSVDHGITVMGGGGAGDFDIYLSGNGLLSGDFAAFTETYAADGATVKLSQALYEILSFLEERNTSGATVTCKKRDGSTTSLTLTLNSATQPTGITRAT